MSKRKTVRLSQSEQAHIKKCANRVVSGLRRLVEIRLRIREIDEELARIDPARYMPPLER